MHIEEPCGLVAGMAANHARYGRVTLTEVNGAWVTFSFHSGSISDIAQRLLPQLSKLEFPRVTTISKRLNATAKLYAKSVRSEPFGQKWAMNRWNHCGF